MKKIYIGIFLLGGNRPPRHPGIDATGESGSKKNAKKQSKRCRSEVKSSGKTRKANSKQKNDGAAKHQVSRKCKKTTADAEKEEQWVCAVSRVPVMTTVTSSDMMHSIHALPVTRIWVNHSGGPPFRESATPGARHSYP